MGEALDHTIITTAEKSIEQLVQEQGIPNCSSRVEGLNA